ncbi:MAG: ribonuclease M5 [Peptostreptococcaceae bacterium]|nr:ribonuclease M5 [Peptostreptococcaceae bacterium]
MEKIKISDIIVVEGKDDLSAVKKVVDAQVLVTNGYSLKKRERDLIKKASEKNIIIIMTDSDYAGETIRKRVEKLVGIGKCKHAFIPRDLSTKDDDIGIENAKPQDILDALKKARFTVSNSQDLFSVSDMFLYKLQGFDNSSGKRDFLGKMLGIGYCNSKQFLSRLNKFGITREEFENAINEYEKIKN